jgi:cytochrome b subunit of formate dehydrogenase
MTEKILEDQGLVVRHRMVELVEHWAIALSGLALVLSGFFQMPTANRYYITSLPGLSWSGDFFVSLNVHYAASIIFIAAALFHLIFHGILGELGLMPRKGDMKTSVDVIKSFFGKGEEPPFHKYLPEQRLAYVGMAVIIAMLILSGLIKTYKNIYAPDMSLGIVLTATWIHNIFFALFFLAFLAHMAAIILKPNRPMIRAIFTGAVRLDYARHRHPLWIAELEREKAGSATVEQTGDAPPEGALQKAEAVPNTDPNAEIITVMDDRQTVFEDAETVLKDTPCAETAKTDETSPSKS